MTGKFLAVLWACLLLAAVPGPPAGAAGEPVRPGQVPVPGMVTMLDLGADKCIPCRMMAPILEELREEYEGRAAIVFIDVWKRPEAAKRFGVQAIPTQIFFDAQGKEVVRHKGFLGKDAMVRMLRKLGVKPPQG